MAEKLKLRAWSRIGKNMIYTGEYAGISIVSGKPMFIFEIQEPASIPFGEYELMQCTDMKDKNGAYIYNRDIVKICEDDNALAIVEKTDNERCKLVRVMDGVCAYMERYYPCELEVIGNIYENPELLGDPCSWEIPDPPPEPTERPRIEWLRMLPDKEMVSVDAQRCDVCKYKNRPAACEMFDCYDGVSEWWHNAVTLEQFRKDVGLNNEDE